MRREFPLRRCGRLLMPAATCLALAAAVLVTAGVAGCGQGPGEGQHPAVEAAVEAMRNTPSFDFAEQGTSHMVPLSLHATGATGTFQSPDRLRKRMGSLTHAVSIGEARYFTEPVSQDWTAYHDGLDHDTNRIMDAIFASPVDTLQEVVDRAGRFESAGVEDFEGAGVERFTWSTRFTRYPLYYTRRTVDIFIGAEDSLVRTLVISDAWKQGFCDPSEACPDILIEPGSSEYTLEFSFPGDEAPIAAPPTDRDIIASPIGRMALFKNPHVPFSIQYPAEWKPAIPFSHNFFTWEAAVFRDYTSPQPFGRHLSIRTRFADDTSVNAWYPSSCLQEPIAASNAVWCAASKLFYAHLAAGTFTAEHENTYQHAETVLSRRSFGGGDGWSAEVAEWTEPFDRGGVAYLHTRQLTHVQNVPIGRPECAEGASHCYMITHFVYQGDAEKAESMRALADYSFSTLEWNGMSRGEGGERP